MDSAQLRKIGSNLGKLATMLCLSDDDDDEDTIRDTGNNESSAIKTSPKMKSNERSNEE